MVLKCVFTHKGQFVHCVLMLGYNEDTVEPDWFNQVEIEHVSCSSIQEHIKKIVVYAETHMSEIYNDWADIYSAVLQYPEAQITFV